MSKKDKSSEGYLTSGSERLFYGLYFVGQNIFFIFLYLFLATYFLDIGIPAVTVAVITLIVKIWDAINDPIFGGIVDRVKFKKGKFIPWLKISLIFIPLTTILIFAIPSALPLGVKTAWAVISYMLWDMAYTICDVPIFGLITTMTDNQNERTSLMAIGRVAASFAGAAVAILVPSVREAIGGWLTTIVVLSIVALFTMIPICFKAKERITPPASEKEIGLKEMFHYLAGNKYLFIIYLALIISNATNFTNTLGLIFARVCLGNESMYSILALAGIAPSVIVGIFIPRICRKIDKFVLYFWSTTVFCALGLVLLFVGYTNFPLFIAVTLLRAIPMGATTVLMFMFTPDCAEYGLYKTGINASGIAFSIQTFSVKLMTAIATALGALFIGLAGYVEGEGAVQSAAFADKLWIIYALVPVIGYALSLIVLRFYKLRDKYVQIMAKCNAGEMSREDAEAQLSGKF